MTADDLPWNREPGDTLPPGVQLWRSRSWPGSKRGFWTETMTYFGDEAGLERLTKYQGWSRNNPGGLSILAEEPK